jgi:Uncharacterized protein involved in cytokinesis, contains TGc (transglutaminase/protease-like) domain
MAKKILVVVLMLVLIAIPINANAQTYPTKSEVYNTVKQNLMTHKSGFTINMSVKTMQELRAGEDLMYTVFRLDDKTTSKDNDYLKLNIDSWRESWTWNSVSGTASLTVSVQYATTSSQETKVDQAIASALKSLNLNGKTDYQKAKAIHNYIINRVSYDKTLQKHSAYNALFNKSAVCEGYSLVAYRMFTDAGLQSRIITGTADGGAHSWNIVKVNGKWYNIDLTWDDPITSSGKQVLRYDYFLKNAKAFSDHKRDTEYNTSSFQKTYPIATTSLK